MRGDKSRDGEEGTGRYHRVCTDCNEVYKTNFKYGKVCNQCVVKRRVNGYKRMIRDRNRKEEKYVCACGKTFRFMTDYKRHITHHLNVNIENNPAKEIKTEDVEI